MDSTHIHPTGSHLLALIGSLILGDSQIDFTGTHTILQVLGSRLLDVWAISRDFSGWPCLCLGFIGSFIVFVLACPTLLRVERFPPFGLVSCYLAVRLRVAQSFIRSYILCRRPLLSWRRALLSPSRLSTRFLWLGGCWLLVCRRTAAHLNIVWNNFTKHAFY